MQGTCRPAAPLPCTPRCTAVHAARPHLHPAPLTASSHCAAQDCSKVVQPVLALVADEAAGAAPRVGFPAGQAGRQGQVQGGGSLNGAAGCGQAEGAAEWLGSSKQGGPPLRAHQVIGSKLTIGSTSGIWVARSAVAMGCVWSSLWRCHGRPPSCPRRDRSCRCATACAALCRRRGGAAMASPRRGRPAWPGPPESAGSEPCTTSSGGRGLAPAWPRGARPAPPPPPPPSRPHPRCRPPAPGTRGPGRRRGPPRPPAAPRSPVRHQLGHRPPDPRWSQAAASPILWQPGADPPLRQPASTRHSAFIWVW